MSAAIMQDIILIILPLLPSIWLAFSISDLSVSSAILSSSGIALAGFWLCNTLTPVVSGYTLKRGLCGKDLGKKGSINENKDIPEALGIVTGTVFLICAIFIQLVFAKSAEQLMVYNSTLFSVCFMIFLGFTDDTLELKWRYKLILPTVASLPLLTAYSGSTALFVPSRLRFLLMEGSELTPLGKFIDIFATVDAKAKGSIIELGWLFLLFMGLLAVFCTNAINILAGINGLECGQAYIIAASILFFKLYELSQGITGESQIFTIVMIIPFIGTLLSLLRFNWYPSKVFVGDTFCYFAGMFFAVVGIHGHLSKLLLLLFAPQIANFLYSLPQLFKVIPCPRHRLPRVDPVTRLMHPSTFPCKEHEYIIFKVKKDDIECPNCTLICLVLRIFGPMTERTLCIVLLLVQGLASCCAFYIRYVIFYEYR